VTSARGPGALADPRFIRRADLLRRGSPFKRLKAAPRRAFGNRGAVTSGIRHGRRVVHHAIVINGGTAFAAPDTIFVPVSCSRAAAHSIR
jgi:hypothetical protein